MSMMSPFFARKSSLIKPVIYPRHNLKPNSPHYTVKTKLGKKALGNARLSSKGLCEEEASLEDAKVFISICRYISETNCVNPDL